MEKPDIAVNLSKDTIYTPKSKRLLACIAALSLIVRLLAAYLQPAFIDEGFVYYVAKSGIANAVHTLKIDAHPPTFNILIYPMVMRTADIFLLRLPWACLSLLTVLLSFKLLRCFWEERDSLLLTALYASSLGIVITDAQLRTYGPLTLCLTALWIGLIDVYRFGSPFPGILTRHPSLRWVLLWLCGCAGSCLHYLGLLSLASCCLSSLFLSGRVKVRTLCCLTAAALPSGAWLVWSRMTAGLAGDPLPTGVSWFHFTKLLYVPAWVFNCNINWFKLLNSGSILGDAWQGSLYNILCAGASLVLWISFVLGWHKLAKTRRWEAAFLGINAAAPPVMLLAACVLGKLGYSQARYSLPMTVPFFILVFSGISAERRLRWQIFFLCVNCGLLVIFPFYRPLWNQSWKDTLSYLNSIRRPNDIIGICPAYTSHCFALTYDPEHISFIFDENYKVGMIQQPSLNKTPVFLLDPKMRGPELLNDLRGYRLILLMCQEKVYKDNGALLLWLDQYYNLAGEHSFISAWDWADVHTYVLEPKNK